MPIRYTDPCDMCGSHYLAGTKTTCMRCLRWRKSLGGRKRSKIRFHCDCGKMAVTVILVRVGNEEAGISEVRLPLCRRCLKIEKETQRILNGPGTSHLR